MEANSMIIYCGIFKPFAQCIKDCPDTSSYWKHKCTRMSTNCLSTKTNIVGHGHKFEISLGQAYDKSAVLPFLVSRVFVSWSTLPQNNMTAKKNRS